MRGLVLALLVAGCVAPEAPPAPRRVQVPAPPLPAGLEAAPTANRKMVAPDGEPILKVEGMGPGAKKLVQ